MKKPLNLKLISLFMSCLINFFLWGSFFSLFSFGTEPKNTEKIVKVNITSLTEIKNESKKINRTVLSEKKQLFTEIKQPEKPEEKISASQNDAENTPELDNKNSLPQTESKNSASELPAQSNNEKFEPSKSKIDSDNQIISQKFDTNAETQKKADSRNVTSQNEIKGGNKTDSPSENKAGSDSGSSGSSVKENSLPGSDRNSENVKPEITPKKPESPIAKPHKNNGITISQFRSKVIDQIERVKVYPHQARREKIQGAVSVVFRVSPDGSPCEIDIEESSGYDVLDNAAISAVKNAAPFNPLPSDKSDGLNIRVKISFILN